MSGSDKFRDEDKTGLYKGSDCMLIRKGLSEFLICKLIISFLLVPQYFTLQMVGAQELENIYLCFET